MSTVLQTLDRAIGDPMRAGLPPPKPRYLALPAKYGDEPMVVCLDTNHWIDLARAFHGHPGGVLYEPVLKRVIDAVDAGRILVPLTASNVVEAARSKDGGRRQRLVEAMLRVSGNHFLLDPVHAWRLQLEYAARTMFLHEAPTDTRTAVLCWGVVPAISPELAGPRSAMAAASPGSRWVSDWMCSPAASAAFMVDAVDQDRRTSLVTDERHGIQEIQALRALGIDRLEERALRAEWTSLLDVLPLREVSSRVGMEEAVLRAQIEADPVRFFEGVPNADVYACLMLLRDRNPEHATHPNDVRDMSFFQSALPYADVAVAEASWSHFVAVGPARHRYPCAVYSRLEELERVLP